MTYDADSPSDAVELTVPATTAFVSVARATTAATAARLGATVDDVEDLRIAVDEACALVVTSAPDHASMTVRIAWDGDALDITVSAATTRSTPLPTDSFAWTILTALGGDVRSVLTEGHLTLAIRRPLNVPV